MQGKREENRKVDVLLRGPAKEGFRHASDECSRRLHTYRATRRLFLGFLKSGSQSGFSRWTTHGNCEMGEDEAVKLSHD